MKRMLLVVTMLLLAIVCQAQEGQREIPLSVWSVGQIDPTNQDVFYSVLITGGTEAATDVMVTAELPAGAVFVKDFWKPKAAEFAGENDGVLTWTMPVLEANVVAGPFTFVVSFAGSDTPEFAPPAAVNASLVSSAGRADQAAGDATLEKLAEAGSIELDAAGMPDGTTFGDTGVELMMYEAVEVSAPATLTVQRLKIDENAILPETAEETWWCGLFSISASSDVSFDQPVVLVVPLLRAATPGTIMPVFVQDESGAWELISAEGSLIGEFSDADYDAPAFARVGTPAAVAYILLNDAKLSRTPVNIAVGVNVNVRAVAVTELQSVSLHDPAGYIEQDNLFNPRR